MNTPQQALKDAYQACLNEALRQSPVMAKRWYTELVDAFYALSTAPVVASEKHKMHGALVALKNNQAAIEQGFTPELTAAITLDTQPAAALNGADNCGRSFSELRFDELELMGDAQVQETLDGARLQQVFLLASDAGLASFSARLSTAQGFKTVKSDKNPLRPEIFSRALIRLLLGLDVAAEVRSRWLLYGAQIMGNQLQAMYVSLNNLLESHGVGPAAYVVISSPDEPKRRAVDPRGAEPLPHAVGQYTTAAGGAVEAQVFSKANSPVNISRQQLLTLDHLHRLMVGEYDDAFGSGNPTERAIGTLDELHVGRHDFSHTVPAAMDVMAQLDNSPLMAGGRKKARPSPPLPVAMVRERLKKDAQSLGQSVAIEVVGLMIEQLTSDSRLLAPVREVIANAEPAFLQLTVTDPRFFSDKNHPARRLLDAITAKSLAYDSETATGFSEFMRDLQKVAALLIQGQTSQAKHFEDLLNTFESMQAKANQQAIEAQNRAVHALLQAEQRNLLAEKIAIEIRQRPDYAVDNRILAAFITGPWSHVMAKERLLGEHAGLGQGKAVFSLALGDMLWSLDATRASLHKKHLVKIIPSMLNAVREGLLTIDYPLGQSKAFFDELMGIHQTALTMPSKPVTKTIGVTSAGAQDSKAQRREALEKAFEAGDRSGHSGQSTQPWLAPGEAHDSGFMDFGPDDPKADMPSHVDFAPTLPGPLGGTKPAVEPDGSAAQTAGSGQSMGIALGAWVELVTDARWVRAQLSWISPHNTLFMFTGEGGRSHSMTARMLRQLIGQGKVNIISHQGVLDGALDSVARTAMRNSVDVNIDF